MGRRSRQRVRGEAANELIRAELEPLEPGEVPRAVRVAAVVALVIALLNLGPLIAGAEIPGIKPKSLLTWTLVVSGLLLVAAGGMWFGLYWAVLGFQAFLALTIITAAISMGAASNVYALVLCVAIIGLASTMFWFLVRAMARIQMPQRPAR